MLVACVAFVKQFWQASDEMRREFQTQWVEIQKESLRIKLYVEMHPDFERSDGKPKSSLPPATSLPTRQ